VTQINQVKELQRDNYFNFKRNKKIINKNKQKINKNKI